MICTLMLLAGFWGVPAAMEQPGSDPVTVHYYYTVRWGSQQEFLDLFRRNHYPVLAEQVKTGRILEIRTYEPLFHGDGRADWTFLVTLTFRSWAELQDASAEEKIKLRLYPDQEKFQREEQRRFELLEAHWDVPLKPAPMPR